MVSHSEPKAVLREWGQLTLSEEKRVSRARVKCRLDGLLIRIGERQYVFLDLQDVLQPQLKPVVSHLAEIIGAVSIQEEQCVVITVTTGIREIIQL